jgi:hypothetical protein
MTGRLRASVSAPPRTGRRPCPKEARLFRPLGLPTSRPDAIEPNGGTVTGLSRKCGKSGTIRPQAVGRTLGVLVAAQTGSAGGAAA